MLWVTMNQELNTNLNSDWHYLDGIISDDTSHEKWIKTFVKQKWFLIHFCSALRHSIVIPIF